MPPDLWLRGSGIGLASGVIVPSAVAKFLATPDGAALYEVRDAVYAVRDSGVEFAKVAAEAALEAKAAEVRKPDPSLSAEREQPSPYGTRSAVDRLSTTRGSSVSRSSVAKTSPGVPA